MFWNVESKDFLAVVEVGKGKVKIKHLEFANDTLNLCT